MDGLNFQMSGFQDDDGTININLRCDDLFDMEISYKDPLIAQHIISNLEFILDDMLDEAIAESFSYNMDEELNKLLEEGN